MYYSLLLETRVRFSLTESLDYSGRGVFRTLSNIYDGAF